MLLLPSQRHISRRLHTTWEGRRSQQNEKKYARSYIFSTSRVPNEASSTRLLSSSFHIYAMSTLMNSEFSEWHCTIIVHVVITLNIASKSSWWSQSTNKWAIYVNDRMLRWVKRRMSRKKVKWIIVKSKWCDAANIKPVSRVDDSNTFSHVKIYNRNGWEGKL